MSNPYTCHERSSLISADMLVAGLTTRCDDCSHLAISHDLRAGSPTIGRCDTCAAVFLTLGALREVAAALLPAGVIPPGSILSMTVTPDPAEWPSKAPKLPRNPTAL